MYNWIIKLFKTYGKDLVLQIISKKYTAFTLAEVLITLGIIGVVASMTIPTLMNSVTDQTTKATTKKEISVLNQVLTLINSDTGIVGQCSASNHQCLRNLFLPYFKYIKTCDSPNNGDCFASNMLVSGWQNGASVVLNDGTAVLFYKYPTDAQTQGDMGMNALGEALIDLNGLKKPNLQYSSSSTNGDTVWIEITSSQAHLGTIADNNNLMFK